MEAEVFAFKFYFYTSNPIELFVQMKSKFEDFMKEFHLFENQEITKAIEEYTTQDLIKFIQATVANIEVIQKEGTEINNCNYLIVTKGVDQNFTLQLDSDI